jgi:hypothetical protein
MTYKYFLWILLCVDCGQKLYISALFFYHCTYLLFCPVCPTPILYYGISNTHHQLAKCSVRKFLVKLITAFIIGWISSIWFVKKKGKEICYLFLCITLWTSVDCDKNKINCGNLCVRLMEKVTAFLLVWNWPWLSCFYIHVCSIIMWNTPYFSKVNVSFNTELQNNMFSSLPSYEIFQLKKPYLLIFPKMI